MAEPTDLDIRINALQQEFQTQLSMVSSRGAALASELASCQAKLKAAEAKIEELTPKEPEPLHAATADVDYGNRGTFVPREVEAA